MPGEPLYIAQEDGWRNYLPLVDDVISLLDPLFNAPPVHIFSAEGITTLTPPKNNIKRIAALFVLITRFSYFAHLRNWEADSQLSPDSYINALKKLGIDCQFKPHRYEKKQWQHNTPHIQRFFSTLIPIPLLLEWFREFRNYFYSLYENTITELLVFLAFASSLFFGRHIYLNKGIKKARKTLPLVIGGWGTRGKSGTERLKAALFNALGLSVVSKTTGCEAMFLHSFAYAPLREMFLFRPYDKATIWEQRLVVQLSSRLHTDVFLWECMGLTPAYVEILQRQWMCDDLSTITNTYPDHEDLQGPAGYNIPEVMTRFIPRNAILISSEEQMQPILKLASSQQNTKFISVGWKQAGLLTDDVLQRFPYDEHPYNIALVLAMSEQLGITSNYALKEMADNVVPDLGVLKTYPTAKVKYRLLSFVMGMSANERYGARGNWTRTGFDHHHLNTDPHIWITALVNNRADRIPRSRVFSEFVVSDIVLDKLVLIGTNLKGFMGYIHDAWQKEKEKISLWDTDNRSPLETFLAIAERYRIPTDEQQLNNRIVAMLTGVAVEFLQQEINKQALHTLLHDPDLFQSTLPIETYLQHESCEDNELVDSLFQSFTREKKLYDSYQKFKQHIQSISIEQEDKELLDQQLQQLLWQWYEEKIVVIDDEHANGNTVIDHIVKQTPPGLLNRIMGLQNIKGTGLDYVYKWLSWDTCHRAIVKIYNEKAIIAEQGLVELIAFQEYNILCVYEVEKLLQVIRHKQWAQREAIQAEIAILEGNFKHALQAIETSIGVEKESSSIKTWIMAVIEQLFDANDAVKRRKKADRIYKDLVTQRISHERAAIELKALNKRQKGGWLGSF